MKIQYLLIFNVNNKASVIDSLPFVTQFCILNGATKIDIKRRREIPTDYSRYSWIAFILNYWFGFSFYHRTHLCSIILCLRRKSNSIHPANNNTLLFNFNRKYHKFFNIKAFSQLSPIFLKLQRCIDVSSLNKYFDIWVNRFDSKIVYFMHASLFLFQILAQTVPLFICCMLRHSFRWLSE